MTGPFPRGRVPPRPSSVTLTCTGRKNDGSTVDIPVTVISATDSRISWKPRR